MAGTVTWPSIDAGDDTSLERLGCDANGSSSGIVAPTVAVDAAAIRGGICRGRRVWRGVVNSGHRWPVPSSRATVVALSIDDDEPSAERPPTVMVIRMSAVRSAPDTFVVVVGIAGGGGAMMRTAADG